MTDSVPIELGTLLDWCRRRPAARISHGSDVDFNVLGEFLGSFAKFLPRSGPTFVQLRCRDSIRESLERANPDSIKVSSRMQWSRPGWHFAEVQLNGAIPLQTLKYLIDDSHQLVCDSLKPDQKHEVDLIRRGLQPFELLDELIVYYGMGHRRTEVLQTCRHSLILKTTRANPTPAPSTRSRIGGEPDLPASIPWPRHSSGRSLAFLAQIDLAEVAGAMSLPDLPRSGLLCVFSVYGWQDPKGADPAIPHGAPADDWTRFIFIPAPSASTPTRQTPPDVTAFPPATIQPIPLISLPSDAKEPVIAATGFTGDEAERLVRIAWSYDKLFAYSIGHPARHLLLGYADYVQFITDGVASQDLKLLLQIASDRNTNMCWGDGGNLYFFIRPDHLKAWDLSHLVTDYQCG